jgi:hypothetical protein
MAARRWGARLTVSGPRRHALLSQLRAHSEQERVRAGTQPAHFVEAQAEQELWQELRDHALRSTGR